MANSRSSPPADGEELTAALRSTVAPLQSHGAAGERPLRIAVALSGGRDSMALLDMLARIAPELGVAASAVHVHHGLSANADRWAAFCAEECAARAVPLAIKRVQVERGARTSLEAAARAARYQALSRIDVDAIVLAHHADDQAETLLLQLLRGAGPRGLAAMPGTKRAEGPLLLRPWLALPRASIESYARATRLRFIDDESNADRGLKRNYLRHEIAGKLAAAFPGYPHTLVRTALHNAEAAELLDQLAQIDARDAFHENRDDAVTLDRAALIALAHSSMARARNLLRWFLHLHELRMPSTARLAAMLKQLIEAAQDSRVQLVHDQAVIGVFRGRIVVHAPPVAPFHIEWTGGSSLALPHGVLQFTPIEGPGICAALLDAHKVTIRQRAGREHLRLRPDRASQPVKRLLYDAGIAPWQRASLPFVYCGDVLAAVADVGIDAAFRARSGAPGMALAWHPSPAFRLSRSRGA